MQAVPKYCQQLSAIVDHSNQILGQLSGQIRELDKREQELKQQILEIEQQDKFDTLQAIIKQHIKSQQYLEAAEQYAELLQTGRKIPEVEVVLVKELQSALQQAKDDQHWNKIWKLFPKLQKYSEGMSMLIAVVLKTDGGKGVDWISQFYSQVYTQYAGLIKQVYGNYGLLYLLRELQASFVLQLESSSEDLVKRAHFYNVFNRFLVKQSSLVVAEMKSSPKSQDRLLQEDQRYSKETGLLKVSNSVLKEQLTLTFVPQEQQVVSQQVTKAMQSDKYDMNEDGISTCVDLTFFAVKNYLTKAIQTLDQDIVCTSLNLAMQVLENQYVKGLVNKLTNSFGQGAILITESNDSLVGYSVLINDLDISQKYLHVLYEQVEQDPLLQFMNKDVILSCATPFHELAEKCLAYMEQFSYTLYLVHVKSKIKMSSFKDSIQQAFQGLVFRPQVQVKVCEYVAEQLASHCQKQLSSASSFEKVQAVDETFRNCSGYLFELTQFNYSSKYVALKSSIHEAMDKFE